MEQKIDIGHLYISRTGQIVIRKSARRLIYQKSNGHCWYCGIYVEDCKKIQVDHFVPHSKGGTHDLSNLVPACESCNKTKRDRSLEQFRSILRIRLLDWPIKFSTPQIDFLEKTLGIDLGIPNPPVFYFEKERIANPAKLEMIHGGK